MGIGGIGGVNGISGIGRVQDYSIQMPQPAKTVIVEETGADSHVASSEQINSWNSAAVKEETPVGEQKPNAQLEDISITFHKQDDFGYIGGDSDIRSLDVEKAISDMRKDQILQQYQYFVGDSRKLLQKASEDGLVFLKL